MESNGPAQSPPPRGPERNTAALLYQAYLRLAEGIDARAPRGDERARPAHAAVFINMEHDGIRLTRLAEKARMTPQAMGELVDGLESWGYLLRVPDPSDRRAKLIVFTDKGHEALRAAFDAVEDVEARLLELLGKRDLERLQRTLIQVASEF